MTEFAIQLAIRFVVFGLVLAVALRLRDDVAIRPRWAIPVVALAIALFNALLYPAMAPLLKLAAVGLGFLIVPLGLNGLLLHGMNRYLRFFRIEGLRPLMWMTVAITAAHAVLYLAFRIFW